ncbi:MAG TPA: hypothetical protein VFA59_06615 [Vicinamibacterales bacterium]|nr:hypothetical protein [Vicinamibacterales bacterium]
MLRALDGGASHRRRKIYPSDVAAPAPETFDPPKELTPDERAVWLQLAPHAFKAQTLTPVTAFAFVVLCRNVVLERRYAGSVTDAGGSNHRGLIQRIDAELARFSLAPMGKPILVADEVKKSTNPAKERFFGGA